jgi:hypothetical protein
MRFAIAQTVEAKRQIEWLRLNDPKKHRKVLKTLALMETNLQHPGLNTHRFYGLSGPANEDVFEAYVENNTPAAYRIFFYYGPSRGKLTILSVTQHP